MHPVLERSDRLAAYLGAWAVGGALLAGIFRRGDDVTWMAALALTVPHATVFGFVSLSTWYVCRTTPLRRTQILTTVLNLAAAAVVSVAFWFGFGMAWTAVLARVAGWAGLAAQYRADGLVVVELGLLLYALSIAINYIAIGIHESRAAERQVLQAQVLAREAELRALRAQIDPHFLFNALNSVNALITTDPAGARRMCVMLSDYLRASSRLGGQDLIRLADEVALAIQYLDIEKIRFGSRLSVEADWDRALGECHVPPLMLQPLVENAVTHGIANLLDGGTIRLAVTAAGGLLTIVIENPRDAGVRKPQTGFGLQNVRKRLDAHFGTRARLDVKDTGDRFLVRVVVPCEGPAGAPAKEATRS
jgi:hypothetical protein